MSRAPSRRLLPLFIALGLIQIVPIWCVTYVPTGDGPSHVYNAWILYELASGNASPQIDAAYRIDWRPHPNWTGHAFMALAMLVVPPLVAEKLLLSLIVAVFLSGAWLLVTTVDPENEPYAFLAFAFTYPQSLIAGFYNFSLSVGLFLVILALWWRRREHPSAATIVTIAALLILCYFTHPMATLLACAAIGLLSLLARRPLHLVALVPAAILLFAFGRAEEAATGQPLQLAIDWSAAGVLAKVAFLHVFDLRQRPIWLSIAVLYALLIAFTLIRRRGGLRAPAPSDLEKSAEESASRLAPVHGLALVALCFAATMFWLPAGAATRALFLQRTGIFVFLILAAWLAPLRSERWRAALVSLLSAIAIGNAAIHVERFRFFERDLESFIRSFDVVTPDTTLLPLFRDPPYSESLVPLFTHAVRYVSLEKRLADLGNYEPGTGYFPIANRLPVDASVVERAPSTVDIGRYAAYAEYVATLSLDPESAQTQDLRRHYRLVAENAELRIYRRKSEQPEPEDLILLPLLGTVRDIGAPHGARWRVIQSIRNTGRTHLVARLRDCVADMPCDIALAPGQTRAIGTSQSRTGYLIVPRGLVASVDIRTEVQRSDVTRPELSISIPAVHESRFAPAIRIARIDTDQQRIGLRIYLMSGRAHETIEVRIRDATTGAIIGERRIDLAAFAMYENANIETDFPGLRKGASHTLDVELLAPQGARIWAFATALDDQGRSRLYVP